VALVVRVMVDCEPLFTVIVGEVALVGAAVKVPVAVAAVGALASKVTPSTVSVELPLMVPELRVPTLPVRLAAVPLRVVLQSFSSFAVLLTGLGSGSLMASADSAALTDDATSGDLAAALERAACWIL
jgi:hypothetical protein